uniref:CSON003902 protein n=1 Tax=Culicoides sonorensis TaxID=179676 RepID=A0A336K8K6_CULSO
MSSLFEKFQKLEIEVEADKKKTPIMKTDNIEKLSYFKFQINESSSKFHSYLLEKRNFIVEEVLKCAYAPKKVIEKELDLALKLIDQSEQAGSNLDVPQTTCHCSSLFLFLIEIYLKCIPKTVVKCYVDPTLNSACKAIIQDFIQKPIEIEPFDSSSACCSNTSFCSVIVTENADIHSAVDEIVNGYKFLRDPWMIKKVYVQENIKEKFLNTLNKRLPQIDPVYASCQDLSTNYMKIITKLQEKRIKLIQASNDDTMKATVAIGIPLNHLNGSLYAPILVLDFFRTIKDVVGLFNKENLKEFISIWSENISETFEYIKLLNVSTIWVNCYGVFNSKCPFVINGRKYDMNKAGREENASGPQSFFSDNFFFSVTSNDNKSVIIRYGQTFAN